MSRKVRWGVLSTAGIARKSVIPAIQLAENAELYGVASLSKSTTELENEFSSEKAYNDFSKLLEDPAIDAVYIPLPNSLHKKWVLEAAKRGKHVLCEKPAALTLVDTIEMVNACQEHGVQWMEGFMYQHHPQHQRVKELIANGEIGDVKHIESIFTFTLDLDQENIRLKPKLGGGCIFDVGCYSIHSSLYLLDFDPQEVFVKGQIHCDLGVELTASGLITFEGGITSSFHCGFQESFLNQYRIYGSKGMIELPYAYRPDLQEGNGTINIVDENGISRKEIVFGHQYKLQIEHFSQNVLNKAIPTSTGRDSIRNMQVIEACYRSLKNKSIEVI